MRFVVYGAGGVGGTIGARLHLAGFEVVLIARGAHLDLLKTGGMRFLAPGEDHRLPIPALGHPGEVDWRADDLVLMTMKTQHASEALDALAACAPPSVGVACVQNGVASERMALRRFERTYATVVNLPALHLEPGVVVTDASGTGGILDTGRYPDGVDDTAEQFTEVLSRAGFSALPEPRVMRQKYAKLLMNLANSVQAAIAPTEDLGEFTRELRREGVRCYEAAGIDCATREEVAERHRNTYTIGRVEGVERVGGSSWQSVARGTGDIEADYLNGEIVLLGRMHGVPTPLNNACQILARRLVTEGRAPQSFSVGDLNALLPG